MYTTELHTRSSSAATRGASGNVPGLQQSNIRLNRSIPDLTTYALISFRSRPRAAAAAADADWRPSLAPVTLLLLDDNIPGGRSWLARKRASTVSDNTNKLNVTSDKAFEMS